MSHMRAIAMTAASAVAIGAALPQGRTATPAALVQSIAGSSAPGGSSDRSGMSRHAVHQLCTGRRYGSRWFADCAERWKEAFLPSGRAQSKRSELEAARRSASGERVP